LGKLVEIGFTADIFKNALHPYTMALLSAIPLADLLAKRKRIILKEEMPNRMELPTGCRFRTRCNFKDKICETSAPAMVNVGNGHQVACHFPQKA